MCTRVRAIYELKIIYALQYSPSSTTATKSNILTNSGVYQFYPKLSKVF